MAKIDTMNAVDMPTNRMTNSFEVNSNPNLTSFKALAPNITGIDKKNENSAATNLEDPKRIAPNIVAPLREVPGIRDST